MIDITEIPSVYRNINTRLLYLHMAMKAGYHAEDLDLMGGSLRQLAAGTGLTFSAVRHGLKILEQAGLLERVGDAWRVKKWLPSAPGAKRAKSIAEEQQRATAEALRQEQERAEQQREEDKRRLLAIWAVGSNAWLEMYANKQRAAEGGDAAAAAFCEREKARAEREKEDARRALEAWTNEYNANYEKARSGDESARRWLARNKDKADARRAAIARRNNNTHDK